MEEDVNCAELLHRCHLKSTKPRNAVLTVLAERKTVLTAEEIYRILLEGGGTANLSTIYRVLELFTEKGLATKSFFPICAVTRFPSSPGAIRTALFACAVINMSIFLTVR